MSFDPVKNFAKVEISTGYASGETSIVLETDEGAKLPDPVADGNFNLVWYNSTDYSDPSDDPNVEIVRCTGKSTDTLTVTRGQESTGDVNHNTVDKTYKFILSMTKKAYDDITTEINAAKQIFYVAEPDANYGNYRVQSMLSGGTQRFTVAIPCDFNTLSHIKLLFTPTSTIAGGQTVDLHSDYAKIGENYQFHSEDSLSVPINGVADSVCELDLSSVTSAIEGSDIVGIYLILNGIGTAIKVFGIEIEYI